MKVVVVNAPARARVYGQLADLAAIEIPVWAGLIAAFLERRDYKVELLDCEAEGWTAEESARQIRERDPALAVFPVYGQQPSASTQCLPAAEAVARLTGVRTICLGTHPSALPQHTLRAGPWTYVAQGEGPHTVLGLMWALDGMGGLEDVPGLWRRTEGGAVIGNAPAPNVKDLDGDLGDRGFRYFAFARYRAHNWHSFVRPRSPYASVQTSLGCPFRCSFCCINAPFGESSIRFWSPANVVAAFAELARQGVENVKIPDEMFLLNPRHVEAICDGLIKLGAYFNIWAYARVDTAGNDALLAKMRLAGFRWLGIGIESASKHVRDGVEKGRFGRDEIVSAVRRIQSHGIHVAGNYIFGLPDDDMASMRATLDLACELNTEWANFYTGMGYPGSSLHSDAQRRGWRLPEDAGGPGWIGYSQHAYDCLPLPTEHLRSEIVLDFRDRAFHHYFQRKEYLDLVEHHFQASDQIRAMNAQRLPRRYWMEGVHYEVQAA